MSEYGDEDHQLVMSYRSKSQGARGVQSFPQRDQCQAEPKLGCSGGRAGEADLSPQRSGGRVPGRGPEEAGSSTALAKGSFLAYGVLLVPALQLFLKTQ